MLLLLIDCGISDGHSVFCLAYPPCLYGILFLSIAMSTVVHSVLELLPRIGRTDVQWSQIRFNGSEPHVVWSSWRLFAVWWRLENCSSNCTLLCFPRRDKEAVSVICDVARVARSPVFGWTIWFFGTRSGWQFHAKPLFYPVFIVTSLR